LPATALAIGEHERMMDLLPHTFLLPAPQKIIDRLPRGGVGQQSRCDARAQSPSAVVLRLGRPVSWGRSAPTARPSDRCHRAASQAASSSASGTGSRLDPAAYPSQTCSYISSNVRPPITSVSSNPRGKDPSIAVLARLDPETPYLDLGIPAPEEEQGTVG